MWPLPGLYFLEMLALSVVSSFIFVRGDLRSRFITWGAAGAMGVFSILGALTVGFFYLPIALITAGISFTSAVRNKQRFTAHWLSFILGAIAQVALMLAIIRCSHPGVIF